MGFILPIKPKKCDKKLSFKKGNYVTGRLSEGKKEEQNEKKTHSDKE